MTNIWMTLYKNTIDPTSTIKYNPLKIQQKAPLRCCQSFGMNNTKKK